jgi:hypothetical protein
VMGLASIPLKGQLFRSQRRSPARPDRTHQGGGLMLWTLFKILMVVWMLQLLLRFGGSAMPVVLVISVVALLLLIIRRISLKSGSLRDSTKTGRFNPTIAEPFAGASKINSSFHNRISKI